MNRRKLATFLTSVPLAALALLAGPGAALADDSEAGSTAVNVADQVVISSTAASTEGDGSASATTVAVGEERVGGTQEGEGTQAGEIVSTGDNEDGELTVGGWEATVAEDESHARTAVVDGRLGDTGSDQYATVTVLESESRATESEGSATSTTGARVDLGGQLLLELLHAETTSDGDGSAALAIVNDEGIGTSEQAGGSCEIPADPLAHLLCLYAQAHSGDGELPEGAGDAGVADLVAADGNVTAGLFQASAAPVADEGEDGAANEGQGEGEAVAGSDEETAGAPSGTLPLTGGGLGAAILGLGMIGTGTVLERFRRRR